MYHKFLKQNLQYISLATKNEVCLLQQVYLLYVSHFIIPIVLYTHNFYHKSIYDHPHSRKYKIGIVVELRKIY